ncbi:MAG TPA: hypothetical protein DHW42_03050 [Candidatus Marinimicrobia bacterium]|nr:hypothetical protein [Candidatus Neomarinimicrobiota bacterium]
MIHHLNENIIEQMTLVWFKNLGYAIAFGPDISPDLFWRASQRQAGIPDAEKFIKPAYALHADREVGV